MKNARTNEHTDKKTTLEEEVAHEADQRGFTSSASDDHLHSLVEPEIIEEPPVDEHTARVEQEVEYLKDQILRARAEFDNYRKRTLRENERIRKMAAEGLIRSLLPVVDNLGLALQHAEDASSGLSAGVSLVLMQMNEALRQHGLVPISAIGERFDPNIHDAVTQMASDTVPVDHVVQEFQKGYRLGDQVLRPSRVAVSTGPTNGDQTDIEEDK